MNREYKREMENLKFSEEAKARITNGILASQEAPAPRRVAPVWRYAAASVAVIALTAALGGVAYASGALLSLSKAFDDLFGGAPAQTEVVDKIGRPIGASAESNGIIITADAVIGDKTNYAIVYSISKSDGSAFEGLDEIKAKMANTPAPDKLPFGFEGGSLTHIDGVAGSGGAAYFYDSDPSDNTIQYVEKVSVDIDDGSIIGKTARADFSNLMLYSDAANPQLLAAGSWSLKFQIEYEDTSLEIPAGFAADCNGMNADVTEITVSPLAICVAYTVEGTMDWEDQESGKMSDYNAAEQDRFLGLPVIVTMNDGTVWDATDSSARSSEEGGKTEIRKSFIFDEFIDLEAIKSLTVGGIEVKLP